MTNKEQFLALVEQAAAGELDSEHRGALIAAEENADLTAQELGFEAWTERWFQIVMSGYEMLVEA